MDGRLIATDAGSGSSLLHHYRRVVKGKVIIGSGGVGDLPESGCSTGRNTFCGASFNYPRQNPRGAAVRRRPRNSPRSPPQSGSIRGAETLRAQRQRKNSNQTPTTAYPERYEIVSPSLLSKVRTGGMPSPEAAIQGGIEEKLRRIGSPPCREVSQAIPWSSPLSPSALASRDFRPAHNLLGSLSGNSVGSEQLTQPNQRFTARIRVLSRASKVTGHARRNHLAFPPRKIDRLVDAQQFFFQFSPAQPWVE